MEKREIKKLGVTPSLLGFGCMRFPKLKNGKIDEIEATKMLDYAMEQGVTYIDTAYPYHDGESESFVGKVLKNKDRSSFYLATKLPVWKIEKEEDVEEVFREQLGKLQTDYVDFYLLHALDKERWKKVKDLKIIETCERLKKEGKIRHLGFSFHDEYEVFEEILTYRDWDFCQIQLNYMDTEEQAGIKGYELAEKRGVPVVIMEPVKGGSLAVFSEDINQKFRALGGEKSIASYALRWAGSLSGVMTVLSGMTTMEQVEDNIRTFSNFQPLSEKEEEGIKDVAATIKSRVQNGCTGCNYCMPCPHGVNIPRNFKIWNDYHMYRNSKKMENEWKDLGENHQAKLCVECGLCEQACPQKIFIRKDLKKVQKDLDEKALQD